MPETVGARRPKRTRAEDHKVARSRESPERRPVETTPEFREPARARHHKKIRRHQGAAGSNGKPGSSSDTIGHDVDDPMSVGAERTGESGTRGVRTKIDDPPGRAPTQNPRDRERPDRRGTVDATDPHVSERARSPGTHGPEVEIRGVLTRRPKPGPDPCAHRDPTGDHHYVRPGRPRETRQPNGGVHRLKFDRVHPNETDAGPSEQRPEFLEGLRSGEKDDRAHGAPLHRVLAPCRRDDVECPPLQHLLSETCPYSFGVGGRSSPAMTQTHPAVG